MRSIPGACALILGLCAGSPAMAADGGDDVQVVLAWFDDPAAVREAGPLLAHAQVDVAKGVMRAEADAWTRARLIAAGFRVEVDAGATRAMRDAARAIAGAKSIPGYACYRTVEEARDRAAQLEATHPDLVERIDLGPSWLATTSSGGYTLQALRLTNRALPGPKPILFALGSIHAREFTPAELLLRFAEELVEGYGSDADATWLLDRHEIQLVVHANPDGRKRAEAGASWRKNANSNFCSSGNTGVDLNRNFPFGWGQYGGSSPTACSETFRGPSAGSEPETQAIVNHVRDIFADRRGPGLDAAAPNDTTGIFLDVHSFGQLVLWPWGFTSNTAPNATALGVLGRRMAGFNGYKAEASVGLYPVDGATDDFAYGELGVPGFTIELGTAFFESCATFESSVLPPNRDVLRYAARSVAAPYLLPSGPDAERASATPDLVIAGDPVALTVHLDDARQQENITPVSGPVPAVQPIASARAWVGAGPWDAGAAPFAMEPLDGAFDAPREWAVATLDTSGLAPGRHLAYAQGRDASGADGLLTAAFVEVVAPEEAARLVGRVSDVASGAPIAATLRTPPYLTTSSAADGRYERVLRAGGFSLEVAAPGYETATFDGLTIAAGEVRERDIELFRLCDLVADPAEAAVQTPLFVQSPWQLRAGAGLEGGAAWMQSSSGNYAHNVNASLTSPELDLGEHSTIRLGFDQRCQTEAGWDFGHVETSRDGGATWQTVFRCHGESTWRRVELELDGLAGEPRARFRFRFTSDSGVAAAGWAVDNIVLQAGGSACRASQQIPHVFGDGFEAD